MVLLCLVLGGCQGLLGAEDERRFTPASTKNCLERAGFRVSPIRREISDGPPGIVVFEGDQVVELAFFASAAEAHEVNRGQPRQIRGNIRYLWIGDKTPRRAEKFDSCVPPP